MSLAEILTRFRKAARLSQEELAELARLNVSTIGDIETGKTRVPHRPTLETLAHALELAEEQVAQLFRAAGRAPLQGTSTPSSRVGHSEPDDIPHARTGPQEPPAAVLGLVKRIERGEQNAGEGAPGDAGAEHQSRRSGAQGEFGLGFASVEELRVACLTSVNRGVEAINKYAGRLYVERHSIEDEFARFRDSDHACFLLQGEAGVGKSNQFCQLAMATSERFPTLLFRGSTHLPAETGFWGLIANTLVDIRGRRLDPQNLVHEIDAFLAAEDGYLFIFMDGINENIEVDRLKQELGAAVAAVQGKRIRICLSCRDVDWRLFSSEAQLVHRLFQQHTDGGKSAGGVLMGYFEALELAKAWRKYADYYELQVPSEVPPGLADICRHPLMLQFLSEAFRGNAIPAGIHRKEIFDRYWDAKLGSRKKLEVALHRVAEAMFEAKTTEMLEMDVLDLIEADAFDDLLSEHVILYLDPSEREHKVTFTYDAFQEYAIATYLRRRWRWSSPAADCIANLRELVAVADTYRPAQGVILYLLLSLGVKPIVREFLHELASQDERWKIFVCDFLTKLSDAAFVEDLVPLLTALCHDRLFTVRWSAASALGIIAQTTCPSAQRHLQAMAASEDWIEREAAASAASHLHREFPVASEMLERLADDISWRVRRAVGSSLDNLCRTARVETFAVFWNWVQQAERWRLRRAVAQAKYGLLADPEAAVTLLGALAADGVDEIRWRVVSDLAALLSRAQTDAVRAGVLALVPMLVRDEDVFVRRHLAFWLPEVHSAAPAEGWPLVTILADDRAETVQWEVARALGFFTDDSQTREMLVQLAAVGIVDVQFAARYSLAVLDKRVKVLLEDPDDGQRLLALREQLARSSRALKMPDQAPDLLSTWKHDRYESIKQVLNEGISGISPERLRDFFTLLCRDEDEGIRWAVASNLADAARLDVSAAIELLLTLCRDPHYWTRRESLSSLGKLVRAGAVNQAGEIASVVERAAGDDDPEVRYAALECIEVMQAAGMDTPDVVLSWLSDDSDRQVAAYARRLSPARVPLP